MSILLDMVKGLKFKSKYFFEKLVDLSPILMTILLPYLMLYIGQYVYSERSGFAVGSEIMVPILILFLIELANTAKSVKHIKKIPVAKSRFTGYNERTDEVELDSSRLQELLIYVNTLEDFLEAEGLYEKVPIKARKIERKRGK